MEGYLAYLDDRAAQLREVSAALAAEQRRDEADLVKVRINVYGICRTIFSVLDRAAYEKKLDELGDTWLAAKELADRHGDVKNAVIGAVKVETLEKIRGEYRKFGGN